MKKTKEIKMYYFFDEAGDTTILGRKGVNLLAEGKVSKVFIVGYLGIQDPKKFRKAFLELQSEAINDAIAAFKEKWNRENTNNIRVIVQKSSEEPMLWAVDYVLWTIQRAYEKGEFRYYNYLKDKISLVIDIFDKDKYPDNYYTQKNLLEAKK